MYLQIYSITKFLVESLHNDYLIFYSNLTSKCYVYATSSSYNNTPEIIMHLSPSVYNCSSTKLEKNVIAIYYKIYLI